MEERWVNDEIKNKYENSAYRVPLRNREGIIVEYALVDKEDYEKVMEFKWSLNGGYAVGRFNNKKQNMSHLILNKPTGNNIIDHKNQDRLDNRKNNLREITKSENAHNVKKTSFDTYSKYKGVSYDKNTKKYITKCMKKSLGSYVEEIEAAKAYDRYTFKYFGKEANNNNLIKYEEIIDIDINDLVKSKNRRDLPVGIKIVNKDKFIAKKSINKKQFYIQERKTLEEAIIDLQIIDTKINYIKVMEEFNYLQQPITRNREGIAIIKVRYRNSNEYLDVIVDDDEWYKLNKIKWNINKGYIESKLGSMHRLVMNAKEGEIIDHINNTPHDNRKCNLRKVSHTINSHNKTKAKNTTSKYFGVSLRKSNNKWRAVLTFNNKHIHIGSFDNEIEAAQAYNKKAIELYGENANLNTFDT